MREQQKREQGKAAAWCGRLLLFAALIAGIVTMHTFGHPAGGHGGHATLSAAAPRAAGHAMTHTPVRPMAGGPVAGHATVLRSTPAHSTAAHSTAAHSTPGRPMAAHAGPAHPVAAHPMPAHPAAHPAHHHAADSGGGGAMDPGAVCRAVLSYWAPALLVLLGAGVLLGWGGRLAGLLAALRALLLRGLRPIPPPPRRKALARLSVLRV
ncbi:hypothetical protein FCH28_08960 [Streptomyces piniterrae]|uniref:Uncharacterized protein n=1 Tax=Streptomyces piniterrae TaxID=2571125 RepID=A0A4U0NMA0_9ACTN|nr:hypothetical protein [Streptomyces piniterrae]TJZ55477.1 hypothetical protein FCH28_08960 [Streptomyces piniterrae]